MAASQRVQQWAAFTRMWWMFDAKWQDPYKAGEQLIRYLRGLHKPIYSPLNDCGDHVVVINSRDIALRGDEWKKRVYFHHTGYPGGATWTPAWELHSKDPTMIVKKAVYKSMKGNLIRRTLMERLHIFPGSEIPAEILENISGQIRPLRPVPKRLDEYSPEVREKFPKVFDYPKDHVLR